jgi:hypothetical protein
MHSHKMWGRQGTAGLFQPAVIAAVAALGCLKSGQVTTFVLAGTAGCGGENGGFSATCRALNAMI